MEPCFLKLSHQYSCMRPDWLIMGCEAQVDSVELGWSHPYGKGMPKDRPHGWKTRYGENSSYIKELTNFRRYRSKVRTWGNLCTIQWWGERCKVKMHPLKYTIPNNGGIQFTGLKEAPTFRMYSYVVRYLESKERWFKGCHPKRLL